MAIYVIGDLHLSLGCNKPMDIFGNAWENHEEKLSQGFESIRGDDITVLAGDISWGISLEQSLMDFKFIDGLPGEKIILKGNHDYWWSTVNKIKQFFNDNHINTIDILHNNAFIHEDTAICGTRGWFSNEDTEHNNKIYRRELARLERSLEAAKRMYAREICCFLHYPPIYRGYECPEITEMLESYKVKACYFGHLHSNSHSLALEETYKSVSYKLVSADYLKFKPLKVV